jgi:hypothetical protein
MKRIICVIAFTVLAGASQSSLKAQAETEAPEPAASEAREVSAEPQKVDRVRVQEGQLIAVAAGESFTITNKVVMPFGIQVMTNLTFTVNGGSPRQLTEGMVLSKDGTLQRPDGSLLPVMDHVTQKDGKVIIYRDGVASTVSGEAKLEDNSTVLADGTYIDRSGRRQRLLDGQLVKLDGATLPATDTATLQGGKVVVQKDGSLITLRPTQTMMMSDGTKVSGDGSLIHKDGTTAKLTEGVILKMEGLRRK